MTDYRAIFEGVESTLIRVGSQRCPEAELRAELDKFKQVEGRRCSDDDAYRILVEVMFYSGFRAATVNERLKVIHGHFPDYRTVAGYGPDEVQHILDDPAMIRNKSKVNACVKNAQALQRLVAEHGSFQAYVDTFAANESEENLLHLKRELQHHFGYLGEITSYHFLMEIGLPVLKPDRVLCRIFRRLGLVEREDQTLEVIEQGRRFAAATGQPLRYIDIVFVAYGQVQSKEFGLESGICLEANPRCELCGVRSYCHYQGRTAPSAGL